MNASTVTAILGAVGALLTVIWSIVHGRRADVRQSEIDRQKWESWIMEQVKTNSDQAMKNMADRYQALKSDFDDLADEKDQMEKQYLAQIALKEEENQALRQTNDALRKENDAYRLKYGGI